MRSLEGLIKELEAEGFRLLEVTRNKEGFLVSSYFRFKMPDVLTVVTLGVYILPPEPEEEEEEEEEQMAYSQEEMEFIRRELSSHYLSDDVFFWLEVMPDIPRWLRDKVLKRREVIASDKGEQPRSGSA